MEEYNNYHSLKEIIELEVRIQATWFLYDCIIDNINNTKYSIVDLQKIKNTIDYISMDTDNIISANMSTGDKDIINSTVKSSGLYSIKEKAFLAGMNTDSCVLKIAVDLFENGIIPIVLSNYCASNNGKESHEADLKCLSKFVEKNI